MTKSKGRPELPTGGGSFVREKNGRLKKEAGTTRADPSKRQPVETAPMAAQDKAAPARGKVKENGNG